MGPLLLFTKFLVSPPLAATAQAVQRLGFDGADLPVRPGAQITHATAARLLPEAVRIFHDHGLVIPSLVTNVRNAAEPGTDAVFAAAAAAGVRMFRMANWPFNPGQPYAVAIDRARRDLESLEPLARKHGVRCNFQIHSGRTLNLNCATARVLLQGRDPHWVGLQIDPGHLALSGEPFEMALAQTGPYLQSLNVKSPRYVAARDPRTDRLVWQVEWPRLIEGLVDWQDVFGLLQRQGYDGPVSVHAEYPVEGSIVLASAWVRQDLAYVRRILAGIRARG